ncbi:hypothetical protein TNCV_981451 [Trichonephila clavipes]|nr:hypothetical protein TNCV_981451 [Trichonephila clavipes]
MKYNVEHTLSETSSVAPMLLLWCGSEMEARFLVSYYRFLLRPRRSEAFRMHRLQVLQGSSYTRAFGDEPRHFEPWSSEEDDTCELATPLLTTTPTGGRLSSRQI